MKILEKVLPARSDDHGATRVGWSLLKNSDECPWQWFMEQLLPMPDGGQGAKPKFLTRAPTVGQWVHAGLEGWFRAGYVPAAGLAALEQAALEAAPFVMVEEDWTAWKDEATKILVRHMAHCGPDGPDPDIKRYDVVMIDGEPMVEREIEVDLGWGGYYFTCRPDMVIQRRSDGLISALDHKTMDAGRAAESIAAYAMDPQITGEQLALATVWPDLDVGVTINAIVKRAAKDKDPRRWEQQDRTEARLQQFRLDMIRRLQRLEHRIEGWLDEVQSGTDPVVAGRLHFSASPSGFHCANQYGRRCAAYNVCLNMHDPRQWLAPYSVSRYPKDGGQ